MNEELFETLSEEDRKRYYVGLVFKERISKQNPDHSKYYCNHGDYIGYAPTEIKCQFCKSEGIDDYLYIRVRTT